MPIGARGLDGYPFGVEERGTIVLDESAVEEEEIWRDDDDARS